MERSFRNTNMKPLNHSSYLRLQVLRENFRDVDEKLSCLSNLSLSDLKAFIPILLSQVHQYLCRFISEIHCSDLSSFKKKYMMFIIEKRKKYTMFPSHHFFNCEKCTCGTHFLVWWAIYGWEMTQKCPNMRKTSKLRPLLFVSCSEIELMFCVLM